MKTKLSLLCSLFAAMSLLALATTNASAQATAFTYQGRLDNGGTPANGFYDVTFTLFGVANGAGQIGSPQTSLATPVSNGLFTVTLDFGANFPGAGRWLELAVRTNGGGSYTVLEPRQPITAAPYAITAGTITGTITESQLPGNTAKLNVANNTSQATAVPVITSGFITGATITSGGSGYITPPTVTVNAALGSGAVLTAGISGGVVTVLSVQNAGSGYTSGATITIAPPPSNSYQVFTSTNYFGAANFLTNANNTIAGNFSGNGAGLSNLPAWRLTGNDGTTAGTHFIGTTDNQPLELKVNNLRALRMEDNGDGSDADGIRNGAPNVIGGSPINFVALGVVGVTISGGGATNYFGSPWPNSVRSDYSTVAGGLYNRVENNSLSATISGGQFHQIFTGSANSAIGGGSGNSIGPGTLSGTIGGGESNDIQSNAPYSTISGGYNNTILNASFATIGGGRENNISSSVFSASIGGGDDNNISASASYATIAGGRLNDIGVFAAASVISGGEDNNIGFNSHGATIAGGRFIDIGSNSVYSVIAGGQDNNIGVESSHSFIGSGLFNDVGTNSPYAVVAGGEDNNVAPDSAYAVIGGGWLNSIGTNSPLSTIGGGDKNKIGPDSRAASIVGGTLNGIGANSGFAVINGGTVNSIAEGSLAATIGGGALHQIGTNSDYGTIGGGRGNLIASNSEAATVAGGSQNVIGANAIESTISGGSFNNIADGSRYSVITGGFSNTNAPNASFATIAGGRYNFATTNAFAAGSFANAAHSGSFVWADAIDVPLASTNANSFTTRASGGYRLFSGPGVGAYLAPNSSSWAVISDRDLKKDFTRVDGVAVLEKLAAIPITQWHYQWESANTTPHIGPMAQDFKAAFYPGRDDKTISTMEFDGVALAAIQGLNQKLETENADLKARLEKLERLVKVLAAKN